MISGFFGEYRWLSNFHLCDVVDKNGCVWRSSEHAYQAMKFTSQKMQQKICDAKTAAEAKKLGRSPGIRVDWNEISKCQ